MRSPLIVICGPTASGKSAVAVELSKLIDGEVVSCDSMQLYRGMDIGTATPTQGEMAGVRHHLISVVEPDAALSAAAYREMALPVIEDIAARGKRAILCGGTGLYINALTRPLSFAEKGDEALRARLTEIAERPDGKRALHEHLCAIDPQCAARLHENDVRRVMRSIEAYDLTGKTQAERMAIDSAREGDYRGVLFAPDWPREALYQRIDRRVTQMIELGLLNEVRMLLDKGVRRNDTAMQAIGYKELVGVIEGEDSLNDAVAHIQQSTRRYAKRQLTWFRADERVTWIGAQGRSAADIAREIMERLENIQ